MLGLHKDKVDLYPYNSEWSDEYLKEKSILAKTLDGYYVDIQHVGSTSIPGLSAKPILDIAVAVKDVETLRKIIPIMTKSGYDVKDSVDDLGEVLARKGAPEHRTHYIHIEVIGSAFWNNHIAFRDYLLKHPEFIKEYEDLKKHLLEFYNDDRKQYTKHKNDFIQMVLEKAKQEK